MDPLPDDFAVGDSPTPASNGVHLALVPGLEWRLSSHLALDLSLLVDLFGVSRTDLRPVSEEDASTGLDWQARLGHGWAFGEALAINYGAAAMNEYVRNANFNQISPRSWLSNVKEGFTYDDNDFSTNQFIHPFNGSQYYNAARSNGLAYWPSYGVALVGALHSELAGETHPMSFNDLISTGVGGAALGEVQYRFSSMMLDNAATGSRRFFREAASFVVDPIRGFNRILSGRAWRVRPNPSNPIDTNPIGQHNRLNVGLRRIGDGPSLLRRSTNSGFMEYQHVHGNVFDNPRRQPFDYFRFNGRIYFGDKTAIGRLMLHGNLWTTSVGDCKRPRHVAAIAQHFEYINSNAYEYGGQSIGPSFYSRWGSFGQFTMESRLDLMATLLGAVNSEGAAVATVADQERIREYDYGPGGGGGILVSITYRQRPLLTARYRLHYLQVTNGWLYQTDEFGLDA
jgi:hypothetical protein